MDLTLKTLIEFRDEMREFRDESRKTAAGHSHRLALLEGHMADVRQRLISLEKHMAALLTSVPVMNERLDGLEARIAALEAKA